jgi:hypothetical protein
MPLKEHQARFENIKKSGWYDPNTRDEIFICDLLVLYYSGKEQDNDAFSYILGQKIPITNNVFKCMYKLLHNYDLIINSISVLSPSRIEELFKLI